MTTVFVPQAPITIDQVPAGVRNVIYQLFATHAWPASKCDLMLESLLRHAQIEKSAMDQNNQDAKIVIHNLLKTYRADRMMQGTCCYQTFHIFVRLLCTLGILKKQVISGQPTIYLLPRDSGYCFQVSTEILAGIDRLADPEHTKNLKMRKKACDVKNRLLLMNPLASTNLHTFLPESPTSSSAFVGVTALGDSLPLLLAMESPGTLELRDSASNTLITESTRYDVLGDSISLTGQRGEHVEHERQYESSKEGMNLPDAAPSSIDSIPSNRISSQKELELESKTGERWTGSEEELSQEAVRYLKLLDGPEYATPDYVGTHAGKQAMGGYKNKIRRNSRLARVAAINALLQRSFYDLTKQKKPLENAGKWFHGSFDRYADQQRPMEITGEILDWTKSSYTLEEIALVLPQERKRQETQWWPPETPHLPFSSCVVTHQYLRDDASVLRMSIAEQQLDDSLLETVRQGTCSQWMNNTEAEQLADEIRHEAFSYLDGICVRPEPRLDENAYVVEASIAETAFPVIYTLPQDWWQHHQEQVHHQAWEEQRKEKKRAFSNERGRI